MYIYKLVFKNGSTYVGKTTGSLETRFTKHCQRMVANTHHSAKLQKVYNTLKELPVLEVLEEVSHTNINDKEVYWINLLDTYRLGLNHTVGGDGPCMGEYNHQAKYTLEDYKAIVVFLAKTDLSLREIASELNVTLKVVEHISCGEAHHYLAEILPEEYQLMLSRKGTRYGKHKRTLTYPTLLSPTGEIHTFTNLVAFIEKHNLSTSGMYRLMRKESAQHKGWRIHNE